MNQFFKDKPPVSYIKPYFYLIFMSTLIVGCTSLEERLKKSECKSRNSYNDGYSDAINGYPKSRFQIYNNKCEQHGVSLNQGLYIKGYRKGINIFCTYKRGYEFAVKAKKYQNTCSMKKEEFLKGYQEGDKQCLFSSGYTNAINGNKDSYSQNTCLKLSPKLSQKQYAEGRKAGLKKFCTYKSGYQWGLNRQPYNKICPAKTSFLKGYRAGDRKCLYEAGYKDAINGETDQYSRSICLKLSPKFSYKQYKKGRRAGLKKFCTYKSGYQLGLNRQPYNKICPAKSKATFLKGYRAGDRKCLYEAGYKDAITGETDQYSRSICLKLSPKFSQKQYAQGRRAGLKEFCTYKSGYQWGLSGSYYLNTCPKNLESKFFQGYTVGKKEYSAEKRHQEKMQMEQNRVSAERERAAAERAKAQALRDQADAEWAKARAIREQTDAIQDQKMYEGYQLCNYDSECHSGGKCVYITTIREYACRY